jgi:hypothetical protein
VAADSEEDLRAASVDGALASWRQGYCVLGEHWFAHRLDKSFTVIDVGRVAADADAERLAICLEAGVPRERAEALVRCEGRAATHRARGRDTRRECGGRRVRRHGPLEAPGSL